MKTSRRDFEEVAKIIKAAMRLADRGYPAASLLEAMTNDLADVLAKSNASFKREVFLKACDVKEIPNEEDEA